MNLVAPINVSQYVNDTKEWIRKLDEGVEPSEIASALFSIAIEVQQQIKNFQSGNRAGEELQKALKACQPSADSGEECVQKCKVLANSILLAVRPTINTTNFEEYLFPLKELQVRFAEGACNAIDIDFNQDLVTGFLEMIYQAFYKQIEDCKDKSLFSSFDKIGFLYPNAYICPSDDFSFFNYHVIDLKKFGEIKNQEKRDVVKVIKTISADFYGVLLDKKTKVFYCYIPNKEEGYEKPIEIIVEKRSCKAGPSEKNRYYYHPQSAVSFDDWDDLRNSGVYPVKRKEFWDGGAEKHAACLLKEFEKSWDPYAIDSKEDQS